MDTVYRRQRIHLIICTLTAAALVILAACGAGPSSGAAAGDNSAATPADVPPTAQELANATFSGILDQPVALSNGSWEGEPFVAGGASRPSVRLEQQLRLVGDLDGDGRDEAAVLLYEHSGGTGTRTHLAVMGRSDGSIRNLGTDLVGDRVQIEAGIVFDGEITLTVIQAGPLDAACCPTEKAFIGWRLAENGLQRTATEIVGTLSLDDLQGPEWVLAEIGFGRPVDPVPEVTIQFDGERVSGTGGCNRYFGTVTDRAPGRLEFSAMGTTMMACPDADMNLERRYLHALAGGTSYGYAAGRLVIGCESEDDHLALVFRRREPDGSSRGTAEP